MKKISGLLIALLVLLGSGLAIGTNVPFYGQDGTIHNLYLDPDGNLGISWNQTAGTNFLPFYGFDGQIYKIPLDANGNVGVTSSSTNPSQVNRLYSSPALGASGADQTEDTMQTYTMPAGTLNTNGQMVRITVVGATSNNTDAKTLQIYFGSSSINGMSLTTSTAAVFQSQLYVMRTGLNTQTSWSTGAIHSNGVVFTAPIGAPNQTETSPIVIKTTCTNGTHSVIACNNVSMIVELINPIGSNGTGLSTPSNSPTTNRLFTSTALAGNGADQTEDVIQTYTMPANTFSTNGQMIRITVTGFLANNADVKVGKIYFGSSSIVLFGSATVNAPFVMTAYVYRTGSSTQTMYQTTTLQNFVPGLGTSSPNQTDTSSIVIKFTGQDSTASTANSVGKVMMTVELINP